MRNGFVKSSDDAIVGISPIDFMTGLKKDATILKRALVISIIFHLVMLWIVFPSKAFVISRDKGTIIDPRPIIPDPKPKPPGMNKAIVKLPGMAIPDPTPFEPEPPSDYIRENDESDYNPLAESEFIYEEGNTNKPLRISVDQLDCYYKPSPVYPELAQKIKLRGVVVIEAVWDTNGRIKDARILSSPGRQFGFDDAALAALREWKCKPAMIDGRKIEATAVVTVNFVMQ